jgi:hypothetical protein
MHACKGSLSVSVFLFATFIFNTRTSIRRPPAPARTYIGSASCCCSWCCCCLRARYRSRALARFCASSTAGAGDGAGAAASFAGAGLLDRARLRAGSACGDAGRTGAPAVGVAVGCTALVAGAVPTVASAGGRAAVPDGNGGGAEVAVVGAAGAAGPALVARRFR